MRNDSLRYETPPEFLFVEPWEETKAGFEEQLAREMNPRHELYGVAARSVARRIDNDDILFALTDFTHPFAVVHLTWSSRSHVDELSDWPATTLYGSFEDWAERCMKRDAEMRRHWNDECQPSSEKPEDDENVN